MSLQRSGISRLVHETRWDAIHDLEERRRRGLASPEDERDLLRLEMGDDVDD